MPSISPLINYLLSCRIVAPLKRFSVQKKRDTKTQLPPTNVANITNINVLNLITNEINAAKHQFTGRKIIMQNLKRLPLVKTKPDISASAFTTAFTLAFSHILRNACMYTDAELPIIVIGERKGTKVSISVLDYGQGIHEEKIEKIEKLLSPSSQKNKKLSTQINPNANTKINTLGLIIAKQSIENIGGSFTLKNHKKVGLLVTLEL